MKVVNYLLLYAALICLADPLPAQNLFDDPETVEKLRMSTKQVNQFFRRFNGEEDPDGDRLYEGDKEYRNPRLRERYLSILFDLQHQGIPDPLKKEFINRVIEKREPVFLDFHGGDFFAEVNCSFFYNGRKRPVILFMSLQEEGKGYEWVIREVIFEPFKELFDKGEGNNKSFIHPMSHELDFMNLRKALQEYKKPEDFTLHDFQPDYLTLFLYELKKGNLKFETVNNVKFHFFQVGGWYFEITNFNRSGYNTGWLISNLVEINDQEKEALLNYIYGRD